MKASDIIQQLQYRLPSLTPYFSSSVSIVGATKGAGYVVFDTDAAHGLSAGDAITVYGVYSPTLISGVVDDGDELHITTLTAHDLTKHPKDPVQNVLITSNNGAQSYKLTGVPNRFEFVVEKAGQPPITGQASLQETALKGYNGLKTVLSVPTTTSIQVSTDFDLPEPSYFSTAKLTTSSRISGAIAFEVAEDCYTSQAQNSLWAFVVLDDFNANKDRDNTNDAFTTQGRQQDFRQQVISNFSVYVFVPNKGNALTDTNGRFARDMIEDIRVSILQSLLGTVFNSGLTCNSQGSTTYVTDGFHAYTGAYYVHRFQFQQVFDITNGDTSIESFSRAFRDIDLHIRNQFAETEYTAAINLDEQP